MLSSGSKKDMGQDGQSYRANMALLATNPIPGKWFTWKKERSALQVCYRIKSLLIDMNGSICCIKLRGQKHHHRYVCMIVLTMLPFDKRFCFMN